MHVIGNAVVDHEFGTDKMGYSSFSTTKNPTWTNYNPQNNFTVEEGAVVSGTAVVKYGTLTVTNYGTITAEFTCPDRYTLTSDVDGAVTEYSATETVPFASVVIGDSEPVYYSSIEYMMYELQQVAGGTVTITFIRDLDVVGSGFIFTKKQTMVNGVKAYYGPDTINIVLDNCTITNKTTGSLFKFTGASSHYINAVFSGNGTLVSLKDGSSIVYTESYVNVTLSGDDITYIGRNNQAIYNPASYNAIINVTGGTFIRDPYDPDTEDSNLFFNCIDNKRSATVDIVITGGVFYNYDPATERSDGAGKPVYAAPGYTTTVVVDGDNLIYTVVEAE